MQVSTDLVSWSNLPQVVTPISISASDSITFYRLRLPEYPIVDTGQTACYDDSIEIASPSPGSQYYGQDAQINGNQPSYTLSGDGLFERIKKYRTV